MHFKIELKMLDSMWDFLFFFFVDFVDALIFIEIHFDTAEKAFSTHNFFPFSSVIHFTFSIDN